MKMLIVFAFGLSALITNSQTYPSFGPEIDVTIIGFEAFDAMEPFISADGNYLFFNNLNDGVNTKLYYASKVNDSTFNYIDELNGPNQLEAPQLDAVADMDSINNFYWTSTRDYPAELNNLFHGTLDEGDVTDIGRVYGDFNMGIPGWLVMDHGISWDGALLYFNNARFDSDNCLGPCETNMGIAQKVNDSTFNVIPDSDLILETITDNDYNYYAPCISIDNLELYYTRYLNDTITSGTLFEICVAVRDTPTAAFSEPLVLFSELISDLIEAPTLTADKQVIYYHRMIPGSHKIVMRYRDVPLNIVPSAEKGAFTIYPNPVKTQLNIKTDSNYRDIKLSVVTLLGETISTVSNTTEIDINALARGSYFLKCEMDGKTRLEKFIKME
ncbi:MAG: hypothetical protein ACI923_002007 [Flavobacteriales bacterium]|jgi:hypothetical protein